MSPMKLRNDTERAIYGAAFAGRLNEERDTAARSAAIRDASSPAEREAAEQEFEQFCAEQAVDYAEFVVEAHRQARKAKR